MAALATPADLALYTQLPITDDDASALLLLDLASDQVRDYLNMQLDYVSNDQVTLDPINGMVFLPEMPVVSVSLVEYTKDNGATWTAATRFAEGTGYGDYIVNRKAGYVESVTYPSIIWPLAPDSWRVTYTHGFAVLPNTIKTVILENAGNAYSSPVSVEQERTGMRQVKYAIRPLSDIQKKALSRYIYPRVA